MPEQKDSPSRPPEQKSTFNPDDPYGVNKILEEKDRQYREAQRRPKEPSALKWLVIFAPMYLLAAMPFAIWLKQSYERHDVSMSTVQESAFVADDKVDYSKEDSSAAVASAGQSPSLESLFTTDMTSALTKLFARGDAQQVKDFFDSEEVSAALTQKLKSAGAWDTPDGLLAYFADNEEGRRLLFVFSTQCQRMEIVNAGLSSGTFLAFTASPAVAGLNADAGKYAAAVMANKDLLQVLSAGPVSRALSGFPAFTGIVKAVAH